MSLSQLSHINVSFTNFIGENLLINKYKHHVGGKPKILYGFLAYSQRT